LPCDDGHGKGGGSNPADGPPPGDIEGHCEGDRGNPDDAEEQQHATPLRSRADFLKRRGLLEGTLVTRGGGFGRTPAGEVGDLGGKNIGRNRHVVTFTV
jgi:hypothetical protein